MSGEKNNQDRYETAIFSGGCFWCMVEPFAEQAGVVEVIAGYSGGTTENPTYEMVSTGATDHFEAVQVTYDPKVIDYGRLVEIYWRQIDPTDNGGQFADRGNHYRTAIFYTTPEQKEVALQSKNHLEGSDIFDKPVVTMVKPATTFYPAEEYHQNYHQKNIMHYNAYKKGSGRADFIKRVWQPRELPPKQGHQPDEQELRSRLSQLQYDVTQKDATEPPFANEFWDNKREGIYLDIVSGEPLFSSTDKFDSGTGWPSFSRPLEEENIIEKEDRKLFSVRTEVRSKKGDSHLGHVFPDGPPPTGLRYCINSAALRFVPVDELAKEGLERYTSLFSAD